MPTDHPASRHASRLVASSVVRRACAAGAVAAALVAGSVWIACGDAPSGTAAHGGPAAGANGQAPATATPALPPIDACTLLAPADVQAVAPQASGSLSSTLDDAVGKDPGQCSYGLSSDLQPRAVSLTVRQLASAEEAASQQRTAESGLRSVAPPGTVADVQGLGDGAFWVGGQIDQLHVLRGDRRLIFTVQLDKAPQQAAQALAAKALARLAHPAPPALSASPGGRP
jgi:hypothetical protein